MKKVCLTFLFLVFLTSAFSQANGYMGKRFIITHNSYYFPAFQEPTYWKKSGRMNSTQGLGLDFAKSNKITWCFSANYGMTGLHYYQAGYSNYNTIMSSIEGDAPDAKLSFIQYSLGIKRFTRNMVAPIGFYLKWEAMYYRCNITYDPDRFYSQGGYPLYEFKKADGGSGKAQKQLVGGGFSIGRQRIFWDRVVVNYGARVSLTLPLPTTTSSASGVEENMAAAAYGRILEHQILNFNLGFGFLAF